MFSFHKPKIYRSNLGCCICKAKSSSSRFTDSKKYEAEFERCFRIQERRSGEICNACVLLVKRWKKLSPENRLTKHWHHVVDARAGPGTKLTGNRRLAGPSSSAEGQPKRSQSKSDVLPLSSSQASNQSAGQAKRSAYTAKACAIDTNVSTFTFGEPTSHRRGYLSADSSLSGYAAAAPSAGYSAAATKPQSALSSAAFESVIKRFRQRQQQQQLEAQRRQLSRQQRQQSASGSSSNSGSNSGRQLVERPLVQSPTPGKRLKRSSECIGSLTIEGVRLASTLDPSVWRKERLCCGLVFRGPCNEVAIFPRLLKACESRRRQQPDAARQSADEESVRSPPPRATKSGSISSCDSNTSGTGSMEQPAEELAKATAGQAKQHRQSPKSRRLARPARSSAPATRRQQRNKPDNTDSNSSTSSSSGHSSARLILSAADYEDELIEADDDDDDDDDDDEDNVDDDDDGLVELSLELEGEESRSTEASSSAESLAVELERKKATSSGAVGAIG